MATYPYLGKPHKPSHPNKRTKSNITASPPTTSPSAKAYPKVSAPPTLLFPIRSLPRSRTLHYFLFSHQARTNAKTTKRPKLTEEAGNAEIPTHNSPVHTNNLSDKDTNHYTVKIPSENLYKTEGPLPEIAVEVRNAVFLITNCPRKRTGPRNPLSPRNLATKHGVLSEKNDIVSSGDSPTV